MGNQTPQEETPRPREVQSVRVICHEGYRGAERPAYLDLDGTRYRITEIRRSWRDPEYEYFKVELGNGQVLVLRHTLDQDDWAILTEE